MRPVVIVLFILAPGGGGSGGLLGGNSLPAAGACRDNGIARHPDRNRRRFLSPTAT